MGVFVRIRPIATEWLLISSISSFTSAAI
jgi:hypothetical protein